MAVNENRLIDANALMNKIWKWIRFGEIVTLQDVRLAVENAPTVDAVEVVHGRWIWGESNHLEWMKCSECLKSQTPNLCFTYCPNCGAKMDGGDEGV